MYYFQITELPKRTLMTVDGISVILNLKYPITSEVSFKNETSFYGEPFDSFKYKIFKNNLSSVNTAISNISFETDKGSIPELQEVTQDIELENSLFFSDFIEPNEFYDRIKITNIEGKGNWSINGNPLVIGQTIFYFDLVNNLKFIANEPGVENDYSVLTWDTGNILGFNSQSNKLYLNSISLGAELELLESNPQMSIDSETGLEISTYFIKIKKGIISVPYSFTIDTNPFPSIIINPLDLISIKQGDLDSLTYKQVGVLLFDSASLDLNGEDILFIQIEKQTNTTEDIILNLVLTAVDGSGSNINPLLNSIQLLIPKTPIS